MASNLNEDNAWARLEAEAGRQMELSEAYRLNLFRGSFNPNIEYVASDLNDRDDLSDAEKWRELQRHLEDPLDVKLPGKWTVVEMRAQDTTDNQYGVFGLVDMSPVNERH